jgi:hypothetical protein
VRLGGGLIKTVRVTTTCWASVYDEIALTNARASGEELLAISGFELSRLVSPGTSLSLLMQPEKPAG